MIYKPGYIYHDVRCESCGDLMKTYMPNEDHIVVFPVCASCERIRPCSIAEAGGHCAAHWDDDESGASSSWDMIVKGYEGD